MVDRLDKTYFLINFSILYCPSYNFAFPSLLKLLLYQLYQPECKDLIKVIYVVSSLSYQTIISLAQSSKANTYNISLSIPSEFNETVSIKKNSLNQTFLNQIIHYSFVRGKSIFEKNVYSTNVSDDLKNFGFKNLNITHDWYKKYLTIDIKTGKTNFHRKKK